jgi:hypothetical protein
MEKAKAFFVVDFMSGIKLCIIALLIYYTFLQISKYSKNRKIPEIKDGRWFIIIGLLIYSLIILYSQLVYQDYGFLLTYLGIPAHKRYLFNDLRVITSAVDCFRSGKDPLFEGNCNPYLVYNYPRLWYLLKYLGVGAEHTFFLAFLSISAFLTSLFSIIKRQGLFKSGYWALLIISPPVVLAIERSNNDIIIFSLLIASLFLLNKNGITKYAGYFLLLLSSLLKLYPVFALLVIFRETKSIRIKTGLVLAIPLLFYLILGFDELSQIYLLSPKPSGIHAFGSLTWINNLHLDINSTGETHSGLLIIAYSLIAVAFILSLILNKKFNTPTPGSFNLDAFRIGAAIYIGCFIIGNNFNYRLIFLLLCIPQLLEWYELKGRNYRLVIVGLITITMLMQYNLVFRHFFPGLQECYAKDLLGWIVFITCCILTVSSITRQTIKPQ